MNTEVMFSSKAMDWATPQDFFNQLDSEFHFTLDPCANQSNHKWRPLLYRDGRWTETVVGGGRQSSATRRMARLSKTG